MSSGRSGRGRPPAISRRGKGGGALDRAEALIVDGRDGDAEALLRRCLDDPRQRARASGLLAGIRLRAGDPQAAIPLYGDALLGQAAVARWWHERGRARYRLGDSDGALIDLSEAVQRAPRDPAILIDFAAILRDVGRLEQAALVLGDACKHAPDATDALFDLAIIMARLGETDSAEELYRRVLQLEPGRVRGYVNLAGLLTRAGRAEDAVAVTDQGFDAGVASVWLWRNRGNALLELGAKEDAAEAFESALALDPEDGYCRYMLAVARGEAEATPSEAYVTELFRSYADGFDEHLLHKLGYRVPGLIRRELERLVPQAAEQPVGPVLDLGCGTGLVGLLLHGLIEGLTGVDLAGEMLEKAREKNVYDQLIEAEAVAALGAGETAYALITAADLLIYMGDLEALFRAVADRLVPGGLFVFSIETTLAGKFTLQPNGRYAQNPAYIRSLAGAVGLEVALAREEVLRRQANLPVMGELFILRRPAP